MKKSIGEKYFSQKKWSVFELVLLVVSIVALIVGTFIRGGGPIGLPICAISILVLVIIKGNKIKDSEIDSWLIEIMKEHSLSFDQEKSIAVYDLKNDCVVKGRDGKLRSAQYVISTFDFGKEFNIIAVHRIDLRSGCISAKLYKFSVGDSIFLCEEEIKVVGGKKTIYSLTGAMLEERIPVSMSDIDASTIVNRICSNEQN